MNTVRTKRPSKGPKFILPLHVGRDFTSALREFLDRNESDHFAGNYLRKEVFSKQSDSMESLPTQERAQAAQSKWLAAESRNATTNQRLFIASIEVAGVDPDVISGISIPRLLEKARREVRWLIGSNPPEPSNLRLEITNGASTRIRRSGTAAASKLEGKAHVTEPAEPVWLSAIEDTILSDTEGLVFPEIVHSSVMFTVPKNAQIDRVACKEPEINMILQRGYGLHMRSCLKKVGIDLHDQSRNREAALHGSRTGELATIDLSSASDLISRTLVNLLLPTAWYVALDNVRVKRTILLDKTSHELEMFSSMGNGFTFELETVLFWAICRAVMSLSGESGTLLVYGDDIIVPATVARRLPRIFSFLGFKVNAKKSFWTGRFRESCGGHYYKGMDVTPFYVRATPKSQSDLVHLLNQFRNWSCRIHPFGSEPHYQFWKTWAQRVDTRVWGGFDIASNSSLYTPGKPKSRFVSKGRTVVPPQSGALLYWHMTSIRRPVGLEPLPGFVVEVSVEDLRLRPNTRPSWYSGHDVFFVNEEH